MQWKTFKHQNLVRHLIRDVARTHPESIQPMMLGNRCFEYVFPVPIFEAAYQRAKSANAQS